MRCRYKKSSAVPLVVFYDEDWELVGLAPLYDVLDITIYENLQLEMGVSSFANMIEHRGADGLRYTLEPDSPFSQSARA